MDWGQVAGRKSSVCVCVPDKWGAAQHATVGGGMEGGRRAGGDKYICVWRVSVESVCLVSVMQVKMRRCGETKGRSTLAECD